MRWSDHVGAATGGSCTLTAEASARVQGQFGGEPPAAVMSLRRTREALEDRKLAPEPLSSVLKRNHLPAFPLPRALRFKPVRNVVGSFACRDIKSALAAARARFSLSTHSRARAHARPGSLTRSFGLNIVSCLPQRQQPATAPISQSAQPPSLPKPVPTSHLVPCGPHAPHVAGLAPCPGRARTKFISPEDMTSRDYYFDSYAHFGIHEVVGAGGGGGPRS